MINMAYDRGKGWWSVFLSSQGHCGGVCAMINIRNVKVSQCGEETVKLMNREKWQPANP